MAMIPKKCADTADRADRNQGELLGDFSLRYLAEILFRRKYAFLLPVVLVPAMSILLTFLMAPSYMSSTTILLGKTEILNPLVRFETAVSLTEWNRLSQFRKIIYSRPLIEDVMADLDLAKDEMKPLERQWLIDDIRRNIHIISLSGDSFQLGCTAEEPELARDMVAKVTDLFIEKSLESSRREASVAVAFIEEQLEHYRKQLTEAKVALRDFRVENIDSIRRLQTVNGDLNRFRDKLLDARLKLEKARKNVELLSDRLAGEKPMVVAQALFVQNTPYKRRYQELKMEMGELRSTRGDNHPEVQSVQRELDYIVELLEKEKENREASETREVRSPVFQEVLARLEDARIETEVRQREVDEYEQKVQKLQAKAEQIPDLENRLEYLRSEVKSTQEIYDALKLKLEHARVSREVELEQQENRFTIIEPPLVPLTRHKPVRKNFLAVGLAGGLMLGFVAVFLLEFIDPRLMRPVELARISDANLLGAMPLLIVKGNRGFPFFGLIKTLFTGVLKPLRRRRIVVPHDFAARRMIQTEWLRNEAEQPEDVRTVVEHIRDLQTSALACYPAEEAIVLGITSALPAEGKTFMVANLATTMAGDLGKPIAVVDANFRHPQLTRLFAKEDSEGLSSLLEGKAEFDRTVVETDTPLLTLIAAGHTSVNPEALFYAPAFETFLEECRTRFAVTLIELPNLINFTEARTCAPHLDGLIFVSRLYATKRQEVRSAMAGLPKEKIAGVTANGLQYWIPGWLDRWI